MIRDSIGLIVAFTLLIIEYSVLSTPFYTYIDKIASDTTYHGMSVWNPILKGAYLVIHGIMAGGIVLWYFSRAHREEYEPDYFTESGWQFETPRGRF